MIGTVVGSVRLTGKLGDGGLGAVYRAVDTASGREVAVRVFAAEVVRDPMLADRLRAMVPALRRLHHENLAEVYDLVQAGPHLGLILEFVPGTPLDVVLTRTGRMETQVAVSCAVQTLRGVEHAHSIGVYHHALRPTNLMVTPQGTLKVMDVGLGHALGANRMTREDRLLHVVSYFAPEQIQNQPGDARSDLYAVGAILYQLLTGHRPFEHQTEFGMRQAHLNEPPLAPRFRSSGVPEWIDQVVMRALAKQPSLRFQHATEMRAVLEAGLGLSTSGSAAVIRDASGVSTPAAFSAAPPIPPGAAAGAQTVGMTVPGVPGLATTRSSTVVPAPASEATVFFPPPPGEAAKAAAGPPDATVMVPPPSAAAPASPTPAPAPVTELAPAAPSAAPAADAQDQQEVRSGIPTPEPAKAAPARKGRSIALVVVLAVLVVAGGAGAGFYWMTVGRGALPAEETKPGEPESPVPGQAETPAAQPEALASAEPATGEAPGSTNPAAPPPVSSSTPQASPPGEVAVAPSRPPRPKPAPPVASVPKPVVVPAPAEVVTPAVEPPADQPQEPVADAPPAAALPDISFRKVKIVTQQGDGTREIDVTLMFLDDRLGVSPAGGGATFRSVLYRDAASASYAKEEKRRLFIKSSKHLFTIETADQPFVLRLDNENFEAIIKAFEARTQKHVER